ARNKNVAKWRDRSGEGLFIDARKLGTLVDRTRKEFSEDDIERIAHTYHAWRGENRGGADAEVWGLCQDAKESGNMAHNYVLTPGRYVGSADSEDEELPFDERFSALKATLDAQFNAADDLAKSIRKQLARVTNG